MNRGIGRIIACLSILATGIAEGSPAWKWTLLNPLDAAEILSMASGEGILLASTWNRGVFRSADTGRSWQPLGNEVPRMFSLEYDSASHRFYGLGDSCLYAAEAQARDWAKLTDFTPYNNENPDLPFFMIGGIPSRFSVHGRLIILWDSQSEGVRVSRDGGATWRKTRGFKSGIILAADSCVFAGDSVSYDGGATWGRVGGASSTQSVAGLARFPGGLLMATDSGVFFSSDRGRTWAPRNGNLPQNLEPGQRRVEELKSKGNSVYALTFENVGDRGRYNIHRSRDGGSSWSALGETQSDPRVGIPYRLPLEIVESGSRLFRSTTRGIAGSVDDGVTWTRVRGLGDAEIISLAVRRSRILALTGKGLFVSADSGASWKAALRNDTAATWTTLSGGLGLHALLSREGDIRVSTDSGATWKSIPMPAPGPAYGLTVLGRNIYLLAAGGLWRSAAEGTAWTEIPLPAADSLRLVAGGTRSLLLCGRTHVWEYGEDGSFLDRNGSLGPFDVTSVSMIGEVGYVVHDAQLNVWEAADGDWRRLTTLGNNGYPSALAVKDSYLVIYSLWSSQISVDGGRSWEEIPTSTATLRTAGEWQLPFTFAVDGDQVYAGDPTGGLWRLEPGFSDLGTGIRKLSGRPASGRGPTGPLLLLKARKIRLDGRAFSQKTP